MEPNPSLNPTRKETSPAENARSIENRIVREFLESVGDAPTLHLFDTFITGNGVTPESATLNDLTREQKIRIGKMILKAAGLETVSEEEAINTYADIQGQVGNQKKRELLKNIIPGSIIVNPQSGQRYKVDNKLPLGENGDLFILKDPDNPDKIYEPTGEALVNDLEHGGLKLIPPETEGGKGRENLISPEGKPTTEKIKLVRDPVYEDVLRTVSSYHHLTPINSEIIFSAPTLQRVLKIGNTRMAQILNDMKLDGIITDPIDEKGTRKVILTPEQITNFIDTNEFVTLEQESWKTETTPPPSDVAPRLTIPEKPLVLVPPEPTPTSAPITPPEATQKEAIPKTPEEIKNDHTRYQYFLAKNKSDPQLEERIKNWGITYEQLLQDWENEYRTTKNKVVESYLAKGDAGKIEAQEFLLKEVELKRKNDLENGLVGKKEKIISGVSKGIEKWDNWGKESWKGGVKGFADLENWKNFGARFTKTSISLAMIGAISGLSVEGLAKMGIGTASALGAGLTSYLGRRVALGTGISTIMAGVSDKNKKWVSATLMAGSIGVAAVAGGGILTVGVGAIVASSAVGVTLAHLTKKYDKKIAENMKKVKSGELNLDTLANDIGKMEREMEDALKKAEKARVLGKLTEGAVAIAGSMATLEVMGVAHDYNQNKIETDAKNNPPSTNPDHPATPETVDHKVSVENITAHKGDSVESLLRRQIEHDSETAKHFGFKGDPNDAKALHEFSGGAAHRIALDKGFYTDGKSAVVHEGDVVKVDDHGNIMFGKPDASGNVSTLEGKYTGPMIDYSGHHDVPNPVHPDSTPTTPVAGENYHGKLTDGHTGTDQPIATHLGNDSHQPSSHIEIGGREYNIINENGHQVYAGLDAQHGIIIKIYPENHNLIKYYNEKTGAEINPNNLQSQHAINERQPDLTKIHIKGFKTEQLRGLSQKQINELVNPQNRSFMSSHLSVQANLNAIHNSQYLAQTLLYKHQDEWNKIQNWTLKDMHAGKHAEYTNDNNPEHNQIWIYIRSKLEPAGFKPKMGNWLSKPETVGKYLMHTIQETGKRGIDISKLESK
jgi:hypothetical protein